MALTSKWLNSSGYYCLPMSPHIGCQSLSPVLLLYDPHHQFTRSFRFLISEVTTVVHGSSQFMHCAIIWVYGELLAMTAMRCPEWKKIHQTSELNTLLSISQHISNNSSTVRGLTAMTIVQWSKEPCKAQNYKVYMQVNFKNTNSSGGGLLVRLAMMLRMTWIPWF